jgi:hypothetical protein
VLLSIVARIACATVLLAAGVLAVVARGPLDEIMDTSFVAVAVMGGPVQVARVCRRRMAGALWTSCSRFLSGLRSSVSVNTRSALPRTTSALPSCPISPIRILKRSGCRSVIGVNCCER